MIAKHGTEARSELEKSPLYLCGGWRDRSRGSTRRAAGFAERCAVVLRGEFRMARRSLLWEARSGEEGRPINERQACSICTCQVAGHCSRALGWRGWTSTTATETLAEVSLPLKIRIKLTGFHIP